MLLVNLREYQYGQTATLMYTRTTTGITAREVACYAVFPSIDGQQVSTSNSELVDLLEPPFNDNPWAEEVTDVVVAGRTAAARDCGTNRASVNRSKLVKALLSGALSLIVLPGIILGVLVNTMAGLALSSAITGLASLVAGIYYYLNKRY